MQQLTRLFTKLARRLNYVEAMNLILDSILYPVCVQAHDDYKIADPVTRFNLNDGEVSILKEFLVCIGQVAEAGEDPFGDLFMEFISGGRHGQYFTPMHLCIFMTRLTGIEHEGETDKRVSDPACGSGRMFLATAAVSGKCIHFFGTDIDDMCCRMAAANMILHNLVADISCGNELTMQFSHVYIVRRVPFFNFPTLRILKYVPAEEAQPKVEEPEAKKSTLPEPKTEQEKYVQGTLF